MRRPAITAAAFALTAGVPADAHGVLHVDPVPDPDGRRLLISVEPLEPGARGFELAALALAAIRDGVAAAGQAPPTVALTRAFEAANAALLAENRPLAGCRWERRVYVGATAAVIAGRTLTIAQVPATQAIVVQDRQLYAFPDLASWCPDYVPLTDQPEPDPLHVELRKFDHLLCHTRLAVQGGRGGRCPPRVCLISSYTPSNVAGLVGPRAGVVPVRAGRPSRRTRPPRPVTSRPRARGRW